MPDRLATVAAAPSAIVTEIQDRCIARIRSCVNAIGCNGPTPRLGGMDFPMQTGSVRHGPPGRVLAISPGEWFLVHNVRAIATTDAWARSAADEFGCTLVDLSAAHATFELRGKAVRDLLARGCGLDLHASKFGTRNCTRTRLAQVAVIVECLDELDRFALHVTRSYRAYLRNWLLDTTSLEDAPRQ